MICLSLIIKIFISCSILATFVSANNLAEKCQSSPLYILQEKYIKKHPYESVNVQRYRDFLKFSAPKFGIRDNYDIIGMLGSGAFAKVFKAKHKPSDDFVALKIFLFTKEQTIYKEAQILKDLEDAPNFLPLSDALKDKDGMIGFIFPLFKMTSYKYLFYDTTEHQIKYFFYETLRTLEYAHKRGIMHRDIKPQNVLMNVDSMEVKVIDWGHGAYYLPGKEYDVKVASLPYKGPELLLNYSLHDYSLDVWSTGCYFGGLLFRRIPFFRGEDLVSQLDAIAKVLGTTKLKQYANKYKEWMDLKILEKIKHYPEIPFEQLINSNNTNLVTPLAIDLLKKMLVYDHAKRITVKEALEHPYFREFSNV